MGNRLSKIYTRTGDDGSTGLGDGTRVAKDDARVEAYGTVDEANSTIGVILAVPGMPAAIATCLREIQHDLFDLGGELCIPGTRMITADTHRTARGGRSTGFNEPLPPLKDFILPGGEAGRSRLPRRAHRLPARRAARLGARGTPSRCRRARAELPQPAVRSAVRGGARAGAARARRRGAVAPRPRPDGAAR